MKEQQKENHINIEKKGEDDNRHISGSLLKERVTALKYMAFGYRKFVYLSKCSLVKPLLQKAAGRCTKFYARVL